MHGNVKKLFIRTPCFQLQKIHIRTGCVCIILKNIKLYLYIMFFVHKYETFNQ